ncbi:hypothetical protein Tsp_03876 [Trichinella spiralis]|uniref:hypothetical protein n=1 Tax=Trichinella spiralis TaxID=6334 RepID=UPI0001EFC4E8|nr:hypothetical protein Tsp_03876 [Trichinella spiralis]
MGCDQFANHPTGRSQNYTMSCKIFKYYEYFVFIIVEYQIGTSISKMAIFVFNQAAARAASGICSRQSRTGHGHATQTFTGGIQKHHLFSSYSNRNVNVNN